MRLNKTNPSRTEIKEVQEANRDLMTEKEIDLSKRASDLETVRDLIGELDLEGFTSEGRDAVSESVEESQDVAEDVFDRDDETLREVQDENIEVHEDIENLARSAEKTLAKIQDSSSKIEG
ncbi:MAG: hypothetical protein KC931_21575, partial [Candidatus Omnitrophica bacterium]|nr:hypothetical protein [Candidatus Omnitrophota bacterium]